MKLFLLIFLFSFAQADGMDSDTLYGIGREAILFFIFFAILSVISVFISKRHAENYERENPLQGRKDKARKERLIERHINRSLVTIKGKDYILAQLSKLLKKKIITEEEFQILKLSLEKNSK